MAEYLENVYTYKYWSSALEADWFDNIVLALLLNWFVAEAPVVRGLLRIVKSLLAVVTVKYRQSSIFDSHFPVLKPSFTFQKSFRAGESYFEMYRFLVTQHFFDRRESFFAVIAI